MAFTMNLRRRLDHPTPSIQMAPLIDVFLVLLIFFLTTWNWARYEAELSVALPRAEAAEFANRLPGEIIINIKRDGTIVINNQERTPTQLSEMLGLLRAEFKDQAVIVRADAKTDYQDVVRVIDICKAANLTNIAFATAQNQEDQSAGER